MFQLNPQQPGAIFGYVNMGEWQGGQAEYVMVPYADWNCLKLPSMSQIGGNVCYNHDKNMYNILTLNSC